MKWSGRNLPTPRKSRYRVSARLPVAIDRRYQNKTNVAANRSTASLPITVLQYNRPLLCGFNVPTEGLISYRVVFFVTYHFADCLAKHKHMVKQFIKCCWVSGQFGALRSELFTMSCMRRTEDGSSISVDSQVTLALVHMNQTRA